MMRRFCVMMATVWLIAAASAAPAQDATDSWLTRPRSAAQLLADRLAMQGVATLAGQAEPTPEQLLQARMLFDLALEQGSDAELWYLRCELARLMQDDAKQFETLREYLRLRPDDDLAQLRLILHRVEQEQTVDARVAMIDKLLSSAQASSLSAELRSRLASYAAGAAKEMGDDQAFASWLKQALQLDSSNITAAGQTYRLTQDRQSDALHVGSALVYMLRCNPADPTVRLSMARFMLEQRAFQQALDQYNMTTQLARSALPMNDWLQMLTVMAYLGQGEKVLTAVDRTRQQLDEYRKYLQEHPEAVQPDAEPPPDMPLAAEIIRVAVLQHLDRDEEKQKAFDELYERLHGSDKPEVQTELLLAAALFNQQKEAVAAAVEDTTLDENTRKLLAGWLALHNGDVVEAGKLFEPLSSDSAAAAYGLALARSDPNQRFESLMSVVDKWPGHPMAMMALFDLQDAQQTIEPTATAGSVLALVDKFPKRLWMTDLVNAPWVTMRIRVDPKSAGYLEPIDVEVTLRNTSGVKLEIGPQTALPTRLWLTIEPTLSGQSLGPQAPIVMDLGRKLALEPNDTLTLHLRVDRSLFGLMLSANPASTLNWRINAMLDPRGNAYGGIETGAAGAYATLTALVVYGQPVTAANIDLWLEDLASDDAKTRLSAIGRLMFAAGHVPQDADAEATVGRITDAVNAAFADMDRVQQSWTVSQLELAGDQADRFNAVTSLAERSDDLLIRLPYVIARSDNAESNILLAALRSDNPEIRQFAEAAKASFERAAELRAERERQAEEAARNAAQ
ncbi:MAG: hypothetical protein IT445_13090 [Phycisphaeraceae bacterium]|nr:hypothetical protein [Phycisphaeraceae bacterium]